MQIDPTRCTNIVCGLRIWLALLILLAHQASSPALDRDIVISVYQGVCQEGEFAGNLQVVREATAEAVRRGSHFVAFPECYLSGYQSREAVAGGSRSLDAPELARFIAETTQHETVVLAGLARRAGGSLFNSVLAIHRGQLLGVYDKVMLTAADRELLGFEAGKTAPVFAAHGVKFAINVGHDASFPYQAMLARWQGAEILFTPDRSAAAAAATDERRQWLRSCHLGLASQFKMAVARAELVASNRPGLVGLGDSLILSPQGATLSAATQSKPEIITATLTPAMFDSAREWADMQETPAWLRGQLSQMLAEFRRPQSDEDLRGWLENMVVDHRYGPDEISAATGLTLDEAGAALRRFNLSGRRPESRAADAPIRILPYPGGRHPRSGFLDGAMMPQRETKFSAFAPWDETSYVVADVPEAIFSNLGLIYLAHTHVPTIWDQRGERLPRLEWSRRADGGLESQRLLPNGIAFGAEVVPRPGEVRMRLWLRNGTDATLSGLRVQNCVMLARADGFSAQTNDNKRFQGSYAVARADRGDRWIITAWDPTQRCWGNERCPCLHSDPQFPDCPPGETASLHGWLSFYEGPEIERELQRIESTGWRQRSSDGR